jgi:hypothetical protein
MLIKTFEQIKSKYRICETNNKFYIQKKTKIGFWSNFTDKSKYTDNSFVVISYIIIGFYTLVLIKEIIKIIYEHELNKVFLLLIIPYIILISSFIYITHFTKFFCDKSYNINQSKNSVDNLVNSEIKKLKLKAEKLNQKKNKVKKYHYFYNESQLRKEKLKILK